jgi:hypothetical protein
MSVSERGNRLRETADLQIRELIDLLAAGGEAALRLPCPARAKLGDGTVAAVALHTADTYHRIASFLRGADAHPHAYHREGADLGILLDRLSGARAALSVLADLTDRQLDAVPRAGERRFCDGRRNLEVVLTSMLKHQSHNVEAVKSALSAT